MTTATVNLNATMSIRPFSLTFTSMSGSASTARVTISVVAVGPSSTGVLSKLQYLSGGVYSDCTLLNPPAGMVIPCSSTGETTVLTWEAHTDLGDGAFNSNITVVGALTDGAYTTADASYSLYITKELVLSKNKYRDEIMDKRTPGRSVRKIGL